MNLRDVRCVSDQCGLHSHQKALLMKMSTDTAGVLEVKCWRCRCLNRFDAAALNAPTSKAVGW